MSNLPADLLDIQREIEGYARGYGLDFYETIFELLDYKQLHEVAAYGGFPTRYPHWRFGMEYEQLTKSYDYGLSQDLRAGDQQQPVLRLPAGGNALVDQKLVMAHVYGHCDFFKNNYWFTNTNRKMIDEMANHATRVRRYIERLGVEKVESFIDACLCLENLIDPMSPFIVRRRPSSAEPTTTVRGARAAKEVPRLRAKDYMDPFINPPDVRRPSSGASIGARAGQAQASSRASPSATCCCSC